MSNPTASIFRHRRRPDVGGRTTAVYAVLLLLATASAAAAATPPALTAKAWPAADRLFTRDPRWLGGDVAASVDLGAGRVLWLFGDSYIGLDSTRRRSHARMVRNTVAIQQGYDPTEADITFYWSDGPGAVFVDTAGGFGLWPTHGCVVDSQLLVSLLRVRNVAGGLGFEIAGWCAALVANPYDEPPRWAIKYQPLTGAPMVDAPVAGSGAALLAGDWLYAFVTMNPARHDAYLLRWARADVGRKELGRPEWWATAGWQQGIDLTAPPSRLFSGASDFSVHHDPALGCYGPFTRAGSAGQSCPAARPTASKGRGASRSSSGRRASTTRMGSSSTRPTRTPNWPGTVSQ